MSRDIDRCSPGLEQELSVRENHTNVSMNRKQARAVTLPSLPPSMSLYPEAILARRDMGLEPTLPNKHQYIPKSLHPTENKRVLDMQIQL